VVFGLSQIAEDLPMDEITTKVLQILSKHARPKPDQISLDTCLESLGIDSLGMMEILFSLEDEFHISIPEADDIEHRAKGLATAADVVRLVESLLEPATPTK
jgi:acyl carrier protein